MKEIFDLFPLVLLALGAGGLFWALKQQDQQAKHSVLLKASLVGILFAGTLLAFLLGLEQANFVSYREDPSAYRIEPQVIEQAISHFQRLKLLIQLAYVCSLSSLVSLLFMQLSSSHIRWISWLAFAVSVLTLSWGAWFSSAPDRVDRELFRQGTAERYIEPKDR